MRIDFVITELFVGGAERCLTELATSMAAAGDDVRVFSIGSLPTGPKSLLVDRLRSGGVEVASGNADSMWQFRGAYQNLTRWLGSSPADVCQTFLFHANVIGTMAAKKAGVAVRVGGLRVAETRTLRCRIERWAVRQMTSLVCVSDDVQKFASLRLGCDSEKSIVIPNAVDVGRFAIAEAFDWTAIGWPSDAAVALFVGRLHPQKGIDLLQKAVDEIAPARSKRRLLIVGDGPDRVAIDRWAGQVGNERVVLLPWQADVAPLMRACRVLVLPSRYEGMPNVAMEAMAAGRPVVCSRAEGARELLGHDWDRQSFAIDDGPSMTRLVAAFLADADCADRTGELNQAKMRSEFSIPTMVDAYRSLYRELRTRRLDV
ncbi:GDP-mannose-dependent alpha-(1-2)-phosphatidylinositol mannosyltransferase [Rubripirellula tenax]|uniref:GDP-mannose-dependent alpha-(1-2)-phosphatidylinositol mannosyltransferase n=1 Tax=Rubripirellula tenax TaxID=2528015 RepID=A0A5C6EHQ0_9BACT|nr:glycosyltransferase [Rubripirellula tenax]TWU47211.1 GDP-mannose-dependent alpha-(1-2)-phosphatidylinositol mannosyltransferase [Rubripirellula tenax]